MPDREAQRQALGLKVGEKLLDPAFHGLLTAYDSCGDGSAPIVLSLLDDTLETVLAQVDAAGGSANVAVATATDTVLVVPMIVTRH